MRMIGYCTSCRRIRQVRVTRWIGRGTAQGICRECEEAEERKRRERKWPM